LLSALQATTANTKTRRIMKQTATPVTSADNNNYSSSSPYALPKLVRDMMNHELLTKEQDLEYGHHIERARQIQEQIDDLYDMQQFALVQEQQQQQQKGSLLEEDDQEDDYIDDESLYAPAAAASNYYNNPDEIDFEEELHNLSVYASSSTSQLLLSDDLAEDDFSTAFSVDNDDDDNTEEHEDESASSLFEQQQHYLDSRVWLQRRRQWQGNNVGSGSNNNTPDTNFLNALDRLKSLTTLTTKDDDDDESSLNKPDMQRLLLQGAMAKNELIRCNVKLVVSIAKKWDQAQRKRGSARTNFVRASISEMIQDGIVGLALAADRYDPNQGFRFSTYATYYITNEIRRCVQTSSLRIPPYYHEIANKYYKVLKEGYGDGSIALDGAQQPLEESAQRMGISVKRLRRALRYTQPLLSLDAPVIFDSHTPEDSTMSYLDSVVEEDESLQPEKVVERSLLRKALEDAMAVELVPHERDILRLRLGLDDGVQRTYKDVASLLGTNTYNIRNTERKAFQKLTSTPLYTPVLVSFLPEHEYIMSKDEMLKFTKESSRLRQEQQQKRKRT